MVKECPRKLRNVLKGSGMSQKVFEVSNSQVLVYRE